MINIQRTSKKCKCCLLEMSVSSPYIFLFDDPDCILCGDCYLDIRENPFGRRAKKMVKSLKKTPVEAGKSGKI